VYVNRPSHLQLLARAAFRSGVHIFGQRADVENKACCRVVGVEMNLSAAMLNGEHRRRRVLMVRVVRCNKAFGDEMAPSTVLHLVVRLKDRDRWH
jgi:hypothetical protein